MAIRLTITDPRDRDAAHRRGFVLDRVVVGRAKSCDVCLPDMAVSTRHAEIRLDGSDYKVVDLGSLNGTTVGGKRLVPHRPSQLKNGDEIGIAGFKVVFSLGVTPGMDDSRAESISQAREMIAAMLMDESVPAGPPSLLVLKGPSRAARYEVVERPCSVRIGRGRPMDIRLDDRDVSREHAVVEWGAEGGVAVRDLGSHNGVLVRGERVQEASLSPGDTFVVGNTTLALEHPADSALATIQQAPEEETSTFSPARNEPDVAGANVPEPDDAPSVEPEPIEEPRPEPEQRKEPPVGPEDPLSYPGQPGYARTTREIPRPEEEKSDLGLIVVGAVIVFAAVAALVYLFS